MGMEVADICMDKEQDCAITYADGISSDASHETIVPSYDHINGDLESNIVNDNAEIKEFEVKECTAEESVQKSEVKVNENAVSSEADSVKDKLTPGTQKVKDESRKSKNSIKLASKSAVGNSKMKHTVPQPFALATEKRALSGTRPVGNDLDIATTTIKLSQANISHTPVTKRQNELRSPSIVRKPLQPDNKKHPDEDDSCSVASSITASARKFRPTSASAPVFRCSTRAERRKEFYSKLEEKHQALEAEKTQCEARTKEEKEAAIKQMRKNLVFKANPMPSFYNEGPPPKVELKKPPPTRAKSPKLGRRKSCSDTIGSDKGLGANGQGTRHSLNIYRDPTTVSMTSKKDNAPCKIKEEIKQKTERDDSVLANGNGKVNVEITTQSS